MKTLNQFLFFFFLYVFVPIQTSSGQKVVLIKAPELQQILDNQNDKFYILNFWASWCSPCIRELPYFEKAAATVDASKVEFILISLDFPSQVEKKLKPFLRKNNITLNVVVMTDLDYNSWISKVDPEWQGNLPATLIFNNRKNIRIFHPKPLEEDEINELIASLVY